MVNAQADARRKPFIRMRPATNRGKLEISTGHRQQANGAHEP
jgi:hypothetical protein